MPVAASSTASRSSSPRRTTGPSASRRRGCRSSATTSSRKWAHIRLEGESFGDVPLTIEAKLEVWDSPNSAGIVIDAVRCCKLALNHGLGGPLEAPSAYLMKSPPAQHPDPVARDMTEEFIAKYGGPPKLPGKGKVKA